DDRPRVSSVVSLFLLAQVFLIVSHVPLVRALAKIILHGDNSIFFEDTVILQGQRLVRRGFVAPEEPLEKSLQTKTISEPGSSAPPSPSGSTYNQEEIESDKLAMDEDKLAAKSRSSMEKLSSGDKQLASSSSREQTPEDSTLSKEMKISTPAADIMASIGISELEATHLNITDEEKQQLRDTDQSG
ncbi:hypothetical protein SK128_005420, partial [Halocaridina rubra]